MHSFERFFLFSGSKVRREESLKMQRTHKKILQLQDPHRQLTLLKYCSSGYKLNHLMRVTDASHYPNQILSFDQYLNDAISTVLDQKLSSSEREMLGYPVRKGGLGIPSAFFSSAAGSLAGVNYLASRIQTGKHQGIISGEPKESVDQRISSALLKVNEVHGTVLNLDEIPEIGSQTTLQTAITKVKFDRLNLAPRQCSLIASLNNGEQWTPSVNLLCSGPLKQHLPAEELRTAIKFQFGLKFDKDGRSATNVIRLWTFLVNTVQNANIRELCQSDTILSNTNLQRKIALKWRWLRRD